MDAISFYFSLRVKQFPDAIQQIIGFFPVRITVKHDDNEIYVECIHKTDHHLTGTIIDEQRQPVAYANVAILNPTDSTLLSGDVSNECGYYIWQLLKSTDIRSTCLFF